MLVAGLQAALGDMEGDVGRLQMDGHAQLHGPL